MRRNKMKIGQQVIVVPVDKKYPPHFMFVRELHNPKVAGLSHTMKTHPENSYGVMYSVIHPIPGRSEIHPPQYIGVVLEEILRTR